MKSLSAPPASLNGTTAVYNVVSTQSLSSCFIIFGRFSKYKWIQHNFSSKFTIKLLNNHINAKSGRSPVTYPSGKLMVITLCNREQGF